jgi:hypothetical protein
LAKAIYPGRFIEGLDELAKGLGFGSTFLSKKRLERIVINKTGLDVKELEFKSMNSSNQIEERFFDLGYLKFDTQKGVYISKEPTTPYALENNNPEQVPTQIMEATTWYLNGKNIIFL